jgi:hypothetical protein
MEHDRLAAVRHRMRIYHSYSAPRAFPNEADTRWRPHSRRPIRPSVSVLGSSEATRGHPLQSQRFRYSDFRLARLEFARVKKRSETREDLRHKLQKFEIEGLDSGSNPEQPQPLLSHSYFWFGFFGANQVDSE